MSVESFLAECERDTQEFLRLGEVWRRTKSRFPGKVAYRRFRQFHHLVAPYLADPEIDPGSVTVEVRRGQAPVVVYRLASR